MKVSVIAAVTIDGKIAKSKNHFPDWTGKSDKHIFSVISKEAGVMIMGSKTFDIIGKVLPGRHTIVMTQNKTRVSNQKNLTFTNNSAKNILLELNRKGYKRVLICGGSKINWLFASKKLIDEIIITFSPITFGRGISLFSNEVNLNLRLKSAILIDNSSILAIYQILK